jgi:putative SOS response-associated peptidase YedK
MCGRFTLRTNPSDLVEIFALLREPELTPRFNIAPTSQVAVVRQVGKARELSSVRWGIVPTWSKDPKAGPPLINARGKTVATKPAFRSAFKKRRCLIPADGFYEWKKVGNPKVKQPYYIRLAKDQPFAFAGLWDFWRGGDGELLESATIVTCKPNSLMATLHDRMPVILADEDYDRWLDSKNENVEELQSLLRPYPAEEMTAIPISTYVNSTKNQGSECIERMSA